LELLELSKIPNSIERTKRTQAYLRSLPPYPEPLPWLARGTPNRNTLPPKEPTPPPAPVLVLTPKQKIDLAPSIPTDDDLTDPIKERLYAQLPDATQRLVRAGNQFPQIAGVANALRDLTAVPFSEANILNIHLQLAVLTDVLAFDPDQPVAERLDADCKAAVVAVVRLLPPITMGHPDIDLLEQRNAEYARSKRAATVVEGERRVAGGLAEDENVATDQARAAAEIVAAAGDTGRVADFRTDFSRRIVMQLSIVVGALEGAVIGFVPGIAVGHAVNFLWLHRDAIMAMAVGWGESGWAWADYILLRVKQMRDDALKVE
ncbi:MAG: hypothetical protein ABJ246_15450, partial [Paracoccaceae bacterium]